MKIMYKVLLVILVFLAVSSGLTKVMLMQQDVEFFGKYGFTNPVLIAFGLTQLLAGILLVLPNTRVIGASLVAITFLISAVVLFMDGNILVTVITLIFVALLGFVIYKSLGKNLPPTETL